MQSKKWERYIYSVLLFCYCAGGYFANSLALLTDAAHMLSDLAGFLISLFAIWVSQRPPSRGMSFGWHRAGEAGGEGEGEEEGLLQSGCR